MGIGFPHHVRLSYAEVSQDLMAWMDVTYGNDRSRWMFMEDPVDQWNYFVFMFKLEADLVMFKLKHGV